MHRLDRRALLTAIGLMVASAAYLRSAITAPTSAHRILIPMDRPAAVSPPMCVDVLNDTGDRGIRIPADVGRGWCGEAGGSATYRFYSPGEGRYTLWAECLWGGVCTNALYVQVGDLPRAILGNDPNYNRWHWVRGAAWPLARGTCALKLSNHSDGIAIRRLALLADPLDRPDTDAPAFFDLFYDGFDGCGGGNISAWKLSDGWKLIEPAGGRDYAHRALAGRSPGAGAPITAVVGEETWHDYTVDMSIRMVVPGGAAVAFGYRGPDDCLRVEWRSAKRAKSATEMRVVRWVGGKPILLGAFEVSLECDRWIGLSVISRGGELLVSVDGRPAGRVAFAEPLGGRLALMLSEGAAMWVDDVHVRLTGMVIRATEKPTNRAKGAGCVADPSAR